VRPASDGTYRIQGLPAGEYYVGAVTTLDLEDLYDPSSSSRSCRSRSGSRSPMARRRRKI
jgi:hypothetical protein